MIITAWILLIMFGFIAAINTIKYVFGGGLYKSEVVLWVVSIIIVAVAAGVIWGGLFSAEVPAFQVK